MISLDGYEAQIRPDILDITCINMTPAGRCKLMIFSAGSLGQGLYELELAIKSNQVKDDYSKFQFLMKTCLDLYKKNELKPNWKRYFDLKRLFGLGEKESDVYLSKQNRLESKTVSHVNKPVHEVSVDKMVNFKNAVDFENNRTDKSKSFNPYWSQLFSSQKKKMFLSFPYLAAIYRKDYHFTKDLKIRAILNEHAITTRDHAENVIYAIQKDVEFAKETNTKVDDLMYLNPYWDELSLDDQEILLTKYPWYVNVLLKNHKSPNTMLSNIANNMERKLRESKNEEVKPAEKVTSEDSHEVNNNDAGVSTHSFNDNSEGKGAIKIENTTEDYIEEIYPKTFDLER
jgi:hypothetical protein